MLRRTFIITIYTTLVQTSIIISIPSTTNLLPQIIQSLDDYDIVVKHYETSTMKYLSFEANYNFTKGIYLFNYDLMNITVKKDAKIGNKKINLIAFNNKTYYRLFDINSITIFDVAIVVNGIEDNDETPIQFFNRLYYVKYVYVYHPYKKTLSYCKFKVAKHCSLKRVSTSIDLPTALKSVPKNIIHFGNQTFSIGYKYQDTTFEIR